MFLSSSYKFPLSVRYLYFMRVHQVYPLFITWTLVHFEVVLSDNRFVMIKNIQSDYLIHYVNTAKYPWVISSQWINSDIFSDFYWTVILGWSKRREARFSLEFRTACYILWLRPGNRWKCWVFGVWKHDIREIYRVAVYKQ